MSYTHEPPFPPQEAPAREEMLIVLPKLCESHRFYHNLDHISRMLHAHQVWKHHTDISWHPRNEAMIYLAIIYHDVVYDIKKGDTSNEDRSAQFFLENSKMFIREDQYSVKNDVYNTILATEHHFDPEWKAVNFLSDYMMDLDLMQLCTSDVQTLIRDNENIDREFLTEYSESYVYESRYKFIRDVMKPNAKLRSLKNEILSDQMKWNIETIEHMYRDKF